MKFQRVTLLIRPLLPVLCLTLLAAATTNANATQTMQTDRSGANAAAITAPAAQPHGSAFRTADLDTFFTKLDNGQPVRVAAIGGSITMHRTGWALKTVDKIREAYPQGQITFVNAGVSGTGSDFGLFRLRRDVTDTRPDLVFVEFAVNDSGAPDATAIRNLESIVVALRSLPEPPAIVFVQSSTDVGTSIARHNRVAKHYGILNVDTQPAIDAHLRRNNLDWKALFSDAVHPLDSGHALYAQTIWDAMQQDRLLPADPGQSDAPLLPKPLSAEPLLSDATLIAPNFQQQGWEYRPENYRTGWLGRYFLGTLQNTQEAEPLSIPFYGRALGIALLTHQGTGTLRIALDGELLADIPASRDWFYSIYIHPELLEERWHVLSLLPLASADEPLTVRIGFLLGQDQGNAPAIPAEFWQTTWPQSLQKLPALKTLHWKTVPAGEWLVAGPFGGEAERPWTNPAADLDKDYGINVAAQPDTNASHSSADGRTAGWQSTDSDDGSDGWVDLGALYGADDRGVGYASLRIDAEQAGIYPFRLALDYFARLYVNGTEVATILGPHGSPRNSFDVMLPLNKGRNDIMLKVHAGSKGFGFRLEYPTGSGLEVLKNQ